MSLVEVTDDVDEDELALELLITRSSDTSILLVGDLGLPNISSSNLAHFSLLSSSVMVMLAGVIVGGITFLGEGGRIALYSGTFGFCAGVRGGWMLALLGVGAWG